MFCIFNPLKKIKRFNPKVIIDGGANLGNYSLNVNKIIPDSNIYAFEPVEKTFNLLKNNISGYSKIIAVNKGLFDKNCEMQINVYPSHTHSSIYDIESLPYNVVETEKINLIKGDNFIKENNISNIDLLKLDLEGAEFDAIQGFSKALNEKKIRIIQHIFFGQLDIYSQTVSIVTFVQLVAPSITIFQHITVYHVTNCRHIADHLPTSSCLHSFCTPRTIYRRCVVSLNW